MAEEKDQVQAEEQEQVKSEAEKVSTPEWGEKESKYKSEIAGLDRKVSELSEQLKAKEMEKLTELEREKAELEDLKKQKAEAKAEADALKRGRVVDAELYAAGLPVDIFRGKVTGQTDEEIKADVEAISAHIAGLVSKKAEEEVLTRLKGKDPGRQDSTPPGESNADRIRRAMEISQGTNIYRN